MQRQNTHTQLLRIMKHDFLSPAAKNKNDTPWEKLPGYRVF